MPIRLRYEPHEDHLVVEVTGEFTLPDAMRAFTESMEWISDTNHRRILVDCRQLIGRPTTIEYFRYGTFIAAEMGRLIDARKLHRLNLAYVGYAPLVDPGHLSQVVATNRGASVISTDDVDYALSWLRSIATD